MYSIHGKIAVGYEIYGQSDEFSCDFTFLMMLHNSGLRRKVVDLNNSCIGYSNVVHFSQMYGGIYPGSIIGEDTICSGAASSIINSNTLPYGGPQDGTDPGFNIIGNNQQIMEIIIQTGQLFGATNTTYTPGVLTADTYFRRMDGSSLCGYAISTNIITKKVMNCGTFTSDILRPNVCYTESDC